MDRAMAETDWLIARPHSDVSVSHHMHHILSLGVKNLPYIVEGGIFGQSTKATLLLLICLVIATQCQCLFFVLGKMANVSLI
ncbi:hypothetical protein K440DRAFT_631387 [Wilcoxina mikolae CBS 423.85]|nr:hypothetical protein K440DRAFT_631387 [Wilcoxina mikolae CBS 423.85]